MLFDVPSLLLSAIIEFNCLAEVNCSACRIDLMAVSLPISQCSDNRIPTIVCHKGRADTPQTCVLNMSSYTSTSTRPLSASFGTQITTQICHVLRHFTDEPLQALRT